VLVVMSDDSETRFGGFYQVAAIQWFRLDVFIWFDFLPQRRAHTVFSIEEDKVVLKVRLSVIQRR